MKKIIKNGLGMAAILLIANPFCLTAQNSGNGIHTIKTAGSFLTITPDARSAGFGDQGAATSADNNSQYWNPAKYVWAKDKGGISHSYTPWLRNIYKGINVNYIAGYYQLDQKQSVSSSFRYFSMGDVAFTDENGSPLQNFKPNEFAFDLAYGRKLSPCLSASVAFRYIHSNLTGDAVQGSKSAKSFAADLGVYYQKAIGKDEMAFGGNISNIGSKMSYLTNSSKGYLPANLRLGGRYTYVIDDKNTVSGLLETTKLLVPTPDYDQNGNNVNEDKSVISSLFSSFGDAPGGFSEEIKEFTYSIGSEYTYQNTLTLRGGYFHQSQMKGNIKFFSVGAGAAYKFAKLDFAYLLPTSNSASNPLTNTFRFTLSINFGGK